MTKTGIILFIFFFIITGYRNSSPPVLFAPGIISTADDEFGFSMSPDGNTCYFCLKSPSTISSSVVVICTSTFSNSRWTEPVIAPFSGRYKDFNPSLSPDGSSLFFISNRPVNGTKKTDTDIWMVKKTANGWGEPKNLGAPVNSAGYELGCSMATNGTLYFSSTGADGNLNIYSSKFINGKYETPELLPGSINTLNSETDPFIAPDESYIIFSSQGRPDAMKGSGADAGYPRADLYVSFRKNGKWTTAVNLGPDVNTTAEESNPWVSADGKTLYFTSERNFISIPMNKKMSYDYLEKHLHDISNGLGDIYQLPIGSLKLFQK